MEVVTLSSDVESEGEGSDVETITRCSNVLSRTDPLPHQASPPDGATVNAPMVSPQAGFHNDLWKVKCSKNSKCSLMVICVAANYCSLFKLNSQSEAKSCEYY